MATIPQELQDAWDAAQAALADDATAQATLSALQDQETTLNQQLAQAHSNAATKEAVATQTRLTFDQVADRLLTPPDASASPTPAPVVTTPSDSPSPPALTPAA